MYICSKTNDGFDVATCVHVSESRTSRERLCSAGVINENRKHAELDYSNSKNWPVTTF